MRVVLAITPFIVGCVLTACASIPSETPRTGYRIIEFDEAMKDQANRSIPLKLAFPEEYAMLVSPAIRGVIWAMPADLAEIRKTKVAPPSAGIFYGRLTPNVSYDKDRKAFCGPSCSEADLVTQFNKTGIANVRTERHEINGIPIPLIEADTSAIGGSSSNKVYMAYIATPIDTNVILISYRPPSNTIDDGGDVWKSFKKAVTESY